jgi:hypothetical protein
MNRPGLCNSVLAVHSGALGDCVLFGHLLRLLGGRVTLVARGQIAALLKGLGRADEALDFDALAFHELFGDADPAHGELAARLGRYDVLVSCFGEGDSRIEARLAAACGAREAHFLPIRPNPDARTHLFDVWLCRLGLPARGSDPTPWPVPPGWSDEARRQLADLGVSPGGYTVIHPGAGARAKCWPAARFAELAGMLASPVRVLGPVELETWPACDLRALEHVPTLRCPPVGVLAGVLAGARAFVGNDSGAAHLAAAVGTPTLAIFGPTSPRHFAPLGRSVATLAAPSLEDLAPRDVCDALARLTR